MCLYILLEGSVIIFVSRKDSVDSLASSIQQNGYQCKNTSIFWLFVPYKLVYIGVALHGDLQQYEREKVLREFKQNKAQVLVATDVAARGLDIKSVKIVINYEVAHDIDSHTHRVGRTGRAGEKGTAYTLITQKEDRFAGELVRHLETSGQAVPSELLNLAMKNSRFRDARLGRRGRGGRGRRGRGRGNANHTPIVPRNTAGVGYHSGQNPSSGMIHFQKSSNGDLHTISQQQQQQRRKPSRWN